MLSTSDDAITQRIIATWKESLTDFSARNPLLYFKPSKSGTLQIDNDPVVLFDRLVSGAHMRVSELNPVPNHSVGNNAVEPPDVEGICTKLRRRAKTYVEETGLSPLVLAFEFCDWESPNGVRGVDGKARQCHAPAVLLPVTLSLGAARGSAELFYEGGEIVINPVLRRALRRDFGLTIPDLDDDIERTLPSILGSLETLHQDQRLTFQSGVVLGLFSFSRLVMVEDLEHNEEKILAHPILGTLLGARTRPEDGPLMDPHDLDDFYARRHDLTVVDADSSQQVAIEAAKAGKSLVIQGPPGTGKSQTITNIIAALLADNKRVLFVSAKRAALDVVLRRMKEVGLDDLCLSAHDDGTDKKAVIADLYQTCETAAAYRTTLSVDSVRQEKLRQSRKTLDDHVTALHTQRPDMGLSVFAAYEELCKVPNRPVLALVVRDPQLFTAGIIDRIVDNVAHVTEHADLLSGATRSLWHMTALTEPLGYERQAEVIGWLNAVDTGIATLRRVVAEIADVTGVVAPEARADAARWIVDIAGALAEAPQVEQGWLDHARIKQVEGAVERVVEELFSYRRDRTATLAAYGDEIFALPLEDIHARVSDSYGSPLKRLFSGQYRRDRAALGACRQGGRPSFDELFAEVATALTARDCGRALDEDADARAVLGERYRGVRTDEADLTQAIAWTTRYLGLTDGRVQPIDAYDRVVQAGWTAGRLQTLHDEGARALAHVEGAMKQVRGLFPMTVLKEWDGNPDFAMVQDVAIRLRSEMDLLSDWLSYRDTLRQLDAAGFPGLIDQLKALGTPVEQWASDVRRGFIGAWVDYQYILNPSLRSFRHAAHERVIEEFRVLDVEGIERSRHVIRAAHAQSVQQFLVADRQRQYSRLASEARKKRQVWPVRKLLANIPEILLHVKPCWMMSPLSVTQMVDADRVHFDVVVFDEASQIRTEEGVCAILRADQVIVVGDDKQLPPTSFFDLALNDDTDDDEPDTFESILDQCAVHLQRCMLRWHYRSRDESLIAFSNQTYYHNQLVTFPNADRGEGSGVSLHFVEGGVYDRGTSRTNRKEAQVVADMIRDHYASGSYGSLGVIALSQAQQAAIQDALETTLRDNPDLDIPEDGPDALFIKNLENVQGDERDVIILSIGYGKTDAGVLNLNFGPLNRRGGERRLNVAITRARQTLTVVSSIRADDIDPRRTASEAMRQLRDYLAFAESNGARLVRDTYTGPASFDSPFEEDVFHMLADRGHLVQAQVGCSQYRIDLALIDPDKPGRYLLGIECDGATYHSSPTARDRDRLRQRVLEGLGWTIHRIWSRDWMRDKVAEIERVEQRLREMQGVHDTDPRIVRMQPCPQCGRSIRQGAHFCGHCRAVVA